MSPSRPESPQRTRWGLGPRVAAAILVALGVALAGCGVPEIEPGTFLEGDLGPGEEDSFRLDLTQGHLYRLTVSESQEDLTVTLEGPEDSLPLVFDTRRIWPLRGDEVVEIVPRVAGDFHATVGAATESAAPYSLRFEELGVAGPPDRARVEADWTFALAEGHRRDRDPAAARGMLEKAVDRYRGLGDTRGVGRVHERLALVAQGAERLEHLARAEETYRAAGRLEDLSRVLWNRGDIQRRTGHSTEALATFEELLALARRIEDPHWTGIALGHLGRLHRRVGSLGRAEALYQEALEIWRRTENGPQKGVALGALGQIALQVGDAERARESFAEAVDLFDDLGRRRNAARARVGLGTAWLRLGDLQRAEEVLRRALEQTLALEDLSGEAAARNDLSNVLYRQGRFGEAQEEVDRARRIYEELEGALEGEQPSSSKFQPLRDGPGLTATYNNLGRIYDAQGFSDLAADHYEKALARSKGRGDRSNQASAFRGLARLERRLGQLDTARATLESALEVVEGLRTDTADGPSRALYLAHRHGYFRELVGVLMDLHQQRPEEGFVALALQVAERSRARGLREILLASRWGMAATAEQEQARRRAIDEHHRLRNRLEASPAAQRRELRRQLETIEAELAALDEVVLRSDPRARSLLDPPDLDLAAVTRALTEDQRVLVFSLDEPESHLFLLGGDGIQTFALPGEQEIERVARRAHQSLAEGFSQHSRITTERDLALLGDWILSPVLEHLSGERLVVVADGVLHYLPFAALPDPRDGRPLVEDFEIVRWPSLATGALLQGQPWSPRDRMMVAADPIFDCNDPRVDATCEGGDYPRLHAAAGWLSDLSELVEPSQSLFLVGAAARYDEVMSAPLADYPMLHLYTHGEVDDRSPELSHLVLTQIDPTGKLLERRFLAYHDIRQLDLRCGLVILGACDTALGQEVRGEGLLGLTQAFFHAGARRVVASLWSVQDSATAELMGHFYRFLLESGEPPSTALRRAQLAMLADPKWSDPYHWAGFELHGPLG